MSALSFSPVQKKAPFGSDLSVGDRVVLAVWGLLLAVAIGFQLESRALFEPDEGRNAEVMREMSLSGDYFAPHLNGLLFLDKPFLYYAAGGWTMKVLGVHELAARLPGVLSALALAFTIALFARRWWSLRSALLAGFATLATPLLLVYTQIVIFDSLLTFWILAAVLAFFLAVEGEPASPPTGEGGRAGFRHWALLAWLAMGLGVLTKGPVALLVPLAAVLPWALWRRRSWRLVEGGAPLALLAVVVPWLFVVSRADPDFLHYALVTETWSRLTSNELKRDAPIAYYLPIFLVGGLPWSVVPLVAWRRVVAAWRARHTQVIFLVLWFVVPFMLFSLMHSKRVHYILPLLPALVLLSVWTWEGTAPGERLPGVRAAAALWAVLGVALLGIGLSAGMGAAPALLSRIGGAPPAAVAQMATRFGVAWILAAGLAALSTRSILRAAVALTAPAVALLLFSAPVAAKVGERRSARDLARAIEREVAGLELVAVNTLPASLPFYLGRTVVLVSLDGLPLRSNYILRRYARLVEKGGSLRSHAWLAGAAADCRTPRAFLVRPWNFRVRAQLGRAGRTSSEVGRDLLLFGPCVNPQRPLQPEVAGAGKVPQ